MTDEADTDRPRLRLTPRRGVVAKTLLGVLIVCAVGWTTYRFNVPHYKGKSIGYWFAHYQSLEKQERIDAAAAFQTMGAEALPYLIAQIEAERSTVAVWFNSLRSVMFRRPRGYNESVWLHRKARAADILGDMGTIAKPAVPQLEILCQHSMWYVRTSARAALIKIRDESPAPFIEALRDTSNPSLWYPNAMLVAELGTNASAAVPILLKSLQHSNGIVVDHALLALGRIQSSPELCVPAITPFLTNGSVSTRQKSFHALRRFGTNAASAADAVIAGLGDSDPVTRRQALSAVKTCSSPPTSDALCRNARHCSRIRILM